MKKIFNIMLLTVICIFVTGAFVFADTTDNSVVDTYNLKVGLDVREIDYKANDNDIDQHGEMFGISGEFIYHGISSMDNYLMASLEFEALGGRLNYNSKSIEESSDNWLVETRGLIGYEYSSGDTKIITPFIGIGYHYWNIDIDGPNGDERERKYWYAPVGIKSWGSLANNWTGGMTAEFDFFGGGVKRDALYGYGGRFSIHFTREFPRRGHSMSFEPYIRGWDNETMLYGMRLSLAF